MDAVVVLSILLGMCLLCWLAEEMEELFLFVYGRRRELNKQE